MIRELNSQYKDNVIDVKEYASKMFEIHKILCEYSEFIKDSMVKKVEIEQEKVIIVIENNNQIIKMQLDSIDSAAVPATILSLGKYEKEEVGMTIKLINMLDDDAVIFDVGANLGWYTLNIIKDRSTRSVYSFEPIDITCNRLRNNLNINNISDDKVFNIGFFKENSKKKFFYDVEASGASSMANLREAETTKEIVCNFEKMDDFIEKNNIERLDFIKCDVEGSELFVYEGGIESINKLKPIIFSEMLRKWSAKFGYHPNDIIDLLSKIGYECFVIEEENLKKFNKVDDSTLETNYFFLHKEKHKKIIDKICIFDYK